MIDERLILAIGRIERALSRLETARLETARLETARLETARLETARLETARPDTAPLETAPLVQATSDPALAARHEGLRARMAEAVTRIDALLGAGFAEPELGLPARSDETETAALAAFTDGDA